MPVLLLTILAHKWREYHSLHPCLNLVVISSRCTLCPFWGFQAPDSPWCWIPRFHGFVVRLRCLGNPNYRITSDPILCKEQPGHWTHSSKVSFHALLLWFCKTRLSCPLLYMQMSCTPISYSHRSIGSGLPLSNIGYHTSPGNSKQLRSYEIDCRILTSPFKSVSYDIYLKLYCII